MCGPPVLILITNSTSPFGSSITTACNSTLHVAIFVHVTNDTWLYVCHTHAEGPDLFTL